MKTNLILFQTININIQVNMKTISCFITLFCAATVQAQYSSTWGEVDSGHGISQTTTTTHYGMLSAWPSHSMQSAHYTRRHRIPALPTLEPTAPTRDGPVAGGGLADVVGGLT